MTTTTVSQEAHVTQADREAAVRFLKSADLITLDRYEQSLAQAFARHRQSAERAFEERERKLRETGQFLLDRLVDHEVRMTSDKDGREWLGHVAPAMARFRQALKETPDAG